MATPRFANAEEYFASFDEPKATTMRKILGVIQENFPDATVKIAWNVPQVQIEGKYVFGMSAAKNHISLAPWSEDVMTKMAENLSAYECTKGLFKVPVDWEVDSALITKLIDARCAELGV